VSQKKAAGIEKMNTKTATAGIKASEGGQSRVERRKQKEREMVRQTREKKQKREKYRVRLIPIWFRLIIVIILLAISLVSGAMIGYGVVGNGDPMDVFHKSTWQHIHDVIYKDVK
jgi:cobalamin biosynthesis Mg chelatase CobN